ncbi:hypothetical protein IT396_00255 [Candidatus Nomurabacteria bacterium]|nr:hypothetical protein [Candidatus Nomurabacteria bacterium]
MKRFVLAILPILVFVVVPVVVMAQSGNFGSPSGNFGGSGTLNNPLNFGSVCGFFKALFKAVIMLGVPVATLFIVWAGFKFVLARGNAEALKVARKNAAFVAIGIAVFLGAWFLSQVIAATIKAVGGPNITTCN